MQDLVTQLGLNFKLLFIQVVGFILLYLLLKKFLFGRVVEMIQRRGEEIRSAYEENQKTRDDIAALKTAYEQKLLEARQEAERLIQEASDRAEKAGQEILEKTRREAAEIRQKGIDDIQQERKRIVSELRNDVINLSVQIAARIIEKKIEPEDAAKLTDDVVNEMGGTAL